MSESEVAEQVAATEREISDAEAWELRYHQEVAANQDLRTALLKSQSLVLALRRRVVELEGEQIETDRMALFSRLDLQDGDGVVLRDGQHILIRAPEKSEASGIAAGTMDAPGGAQNEEDAGE
jgi:hypothetical protein